MLRSSVGAGVPGLRRPGSTVWRISSRTHGYASFSFMGGRARFLACASGGGAETWQKRRAVGIQIGLQSGFVHDAANGVVRGAQAVRLLLRAGRRSRPSDDHRASLARLEFIEGVLDLLAFPVERRELMRRL